MKLPAIAMRGERTSQVLLYTLWLTHKPLVKTHTQDLAQQLLNKRIEFV